MGNSSRFGSATCELPSDYLIFSNLNLRTFRSIFYENLELLYYRQKNTLHQIFMSLSYTLIQSLFLTLNIYFVKSISFVTTEFTLPSCIVILFIFIRNIVTYLLELSSFLRLLIPAICIIIIYDCQLSQHGCKKLVMLQTEF